MKKIDWRLLLIVACALVTAASAVMMTRHTANLGTLVEVIPPSGAAMITTAPDGLQLELGAQGLTMTVPGCNIDKFQDKFFLHLYTKAGLEKTPSPFINLDFFLSQQTRREVSVNGAKSCVYFKSFSDFAPQMVNMGQFTTPGGRCCEVTWSRSWTFDKSLLQPR